MLTATCAYSQDDKKVAFLPGFEEIPKMDELYVNEENTTVVDALDFNFIETYGESTTLSSDKFISFYSQTLNQLGFTALDSNPISSNEANVIETYQFVRDDNLLVIDILKKDPLVVRFTMAPQSSNQ